MDKELVFRTFCYLIGHYKTHDETIINSQEIEAIEFILKNNKDLKQQETIDKVNHILSNQMDYWDYIDVINDIEDVLKEVSE